MEYDNELVREAWINFKTGDIAAARRFAERALLIVDDTDTRIKASFILSQISDDPKEKRDLIETVLAYDPNHAEARRALAILDGKLKPEDIVDADNLPAQSTDTQNASADRFACPKCGARRVFAPDGKNLVCEHCGYNNTLVNHKQADEQDFFTAMATAKGHDKPVAMQVFHCQGCGAEFVLAPGVLSATCAYCDSPHVVQLEQSRELIEPEGILPHALTQKHVVQSLVTWVEQNKLKPKGKVDFPRGVYLPIWTFNLGGVINYSGEIVETKYQGLRHTQSLVTVHDDYPVLINDWPIPASRKSADKIARLLATFDLSAVQPYDPRFLANWPAEIYDLSMSDASLEARSQALAHFKENLPAELLRLNDLRISSGNMAVQSFKLVLLPIWMTEIPLAGEKRSILINGQNGRVLAELPEQTVGNWLDSLLGQ